MATYLSNRQDRMRSAAAAVAVQALLGYALVTGLAVHFTVPASDPLAVFSTSEEPPPAPTPPPVPDPAKDTRKEGEASPANLRSTATEIVAPPPVIPVVAPPPIVAAPIPNVGVQATQGAADVPGPGTGSGGIGNGTGSGGAGDGDGGGDAETPPRWMRGRLSDSDFPAGLGEAGIGGTVGVRYTVAANGRVTDCSITSSSGSSELDSLTCRLIRDRFRFRPSLDGAGRPVASVIVENHSWINELDEEEPGDVRASRGRSRR